MADGQTPIAPPETEVLDLMAKTIHALETLKGGENDGTGIALIQAIVYFKHAMAYYQDTVVLQREFAKKANDIELRAVDVLLELGHMLHTARFNETDEARKESYCLVMAKADYLHDYYIRKIVSER